MSDLVGLSSIPPEYGPGAGQVARPQPALDPNILAGTLNSLPDGGAEVIYPEEFQQPTADDVPFDGNLAEVLPDTLLDDILNRLMEGIEADIESNRGHWEQFEQGVDLLGLDPKRRLDYPFKGASGATHPLLKMAVLSFRATARKELLPASGPVRSQIIADPTPQDIGALEQRAQRKQNWMNYYLTHEDEEYYPDYNQMLLLLGLWGSMFRHVWRDPLRGGSPFSRFLSPKDLVVNYGATSLCGPQRVTRIETNVPYADVRKLQLKGWYRNIPLILPTGDTDIPDKARELEERSPSEIDEDRPYEICHVHYSMDIQGLEHRDENGEETGMPIPFVVSLDRNSQKILRISRNWKQGDPEYKPREHYVHYRYMPGLGFLGWGLPHLVGSDTDTLTTLLRQAVNANTLVSFPAGLRVKGAAKTDSNRTLLGPGEWAEVDTGGLPISQASSVLPYKDVPASFPILMQTIQEQAQRTASIGDMAVGEGREDALPGTVIALIEKAVKLESAVIADQHVSQRKEYRLLAELFGEDQQAVYPYILNGQRGQAIAADFQDNADIIPVSDPNIPTQTQRLAQAQAKLQMAQQSGGAMDVRYAMQNMLRTMGDSDAEIERMMPDQPQGQPADPVTEFQMLMKQQPLAVGPTQDHGAHIQAHTAQMASPGIDKTPMGAALQAHIGDHLAAFYAAQAGALTGMPIQPGQQLPPQVEAQIARAVAAASNQLAVQLQSLAPAQKTDPTAMAKIQSDMLKTHASEADSQRKDQQSARSTQADLIKLRQQMANDAQQRAHQERMAALSLTEARVKASADTSGAVLGHLAELGVAQHETAQSALSRSADAIRSKADMHVADKEAEAARAAAQAAKRTQR